MLIAALSGRSLAVAAREAGYRPLVADLFGDLDTREVSEAVDVVGGGLARGLGGGAVLRALARLARGRDPVALVYGAGFEARPGALSRLSRRWPLAGNDATLVARLKQPEEFAALCASLGVPHPEIRRRRPRPPQGWLAKRAGGSGGAHVRPAAEAGRAGRAGYYQREVEGESIGLLFLADGRRALPVGFTRQWVDPSPGAPFRYGGAARVEPAHVPYRDAMAEAVRGFASLGLKGLNSADFLVSDKGIWLLEINPRPGASLDVFGERADVLFRAHLDACAGELPPAAPSFDGSRAALVVYAARRVPSIPRLDWPAWSSDRQAPGTRVDEGEPLCTVFADAASADAAIRLATRRGREIHAKLEGAE